MWLLSQAHALNPEAGTHPVTDDPREVEAALRASERSFAEFPYYQARYGERGRRFGHSDGAWLALVADHGPAEVDGEVLWLGHVLASRGMPRLLLEWHLGALHHELSAAVPERAAAYGRLLDAATMLRRLRHDAIGEDAFQALARDFDAAVGPEWSRRLPRMGEIIVSAVADERNGIPESLTSLEPWLTDPEHFPPAWTDAVRRTIASAREAAR
jgi:hypothetical protein